MLETVCASAEKLADLVLHIDEIEKRTVMDMAEWSAARSELRRGARRIKREVEDARARLCEAAEAARPLLSGLCRCGSPACPQPPVNPANDSLPMEPSIA